MAVSTRLDLLLYPRQGSLTDGASLRQTADRWSIGWDCVTDAHWPIRSNDMPANIWNTLWWVHSSKLLKYLISDTMNILRYIHIAIISLTHHFYLSIASWSNSFWRINKLWKKTTNRATLWVERQMQAADLKVQLKKSLVVHYLPWRNPPTSHYLNRVDNIIEHSPHLGHQPFNWTLWAVLHVNQNIQIQRQFPKAISKPSVLLVSLTQPAATTTH